MTILAYGALWFIFGVIHSLMARQFVKKRLKTAFGPFYRLVYNGIATLQVLLIYMVGLSLFASFDDYDHTPLWQGVQWAVYIAGWFLMLVALREYDLGLLAGTKQLRQHFAGVKPDEDEPFHFKGVHCWVRHPLYSAGFLILWGRVGNDLDLWTAVFASLYLVIGTWFEERHLIAIYGEVYVRYKERVPAFIPLKGRIYLKDLNHE